MKTTDQPKLPATTIVTAEMQQRIDAGRLDYRNDVKWHDPRGYKAKSKRRGK